MQILSSALPGFREIRGPIIAGYMWLLFMWLIVAPDLDTRPHSRVGGSIYDLAQDVERVGVVAAVSVAAYLIGAVSGELADVLRRAGNKLWQARLGPTFMVTAEEEIRRLWVQNRSRRGMKPR